MKIAISASRGDVNAAVDPRFGRCPYYVFVETETDAIEIVQNQSAMAGGGAGIQAAQFVVQQGVQAVVTGNMGPNAFQVFDAAGVAIYTAPNMTVSQAVEAFNAGDLTQIGAATGPSHAGMGRGRGVGANVPTPTPPASAPSTSEPDELSALKQEVSELRKSVATLLEKVDALTQES
jgi:predicted Fe-Mo cluster-binding NifX family protein